MFVHQYDSLPSASERFDCPEIPLVELAVAPRPEAAAAREKMIRRCC